MLARRDEGVSMQVLLLPFTPRYILLTIALTGTLAFGVAAVSFPAEEPYLIPPLVIFACFLALGIRDLQQTRHAILRNYPIAAHTASSSSTSVPSSGNISSRRKKTAPPFRATSALSSISVPSSSSTPARSGPITTSIAITTSGCTTRCCQRSRAASTSASSSVGPIARSLMPPRSSTSPP
jgi:hypothetical protein